MKVRFNCDSGANVHSNHVSVWFDTVKDLGLDEGEWEEMLEKDKIQMAEEWAYDYLEIYYEEKK